MEVGLSRTELRGSSSTMLKRKVGFKLKSPWVIDSHSKFFFKQKEFSENTPDAALTKFTVLNEFNSVSFNFFELKEFIHFQMKSLCSRDINSLPCNIFYTL